MTVPTLRLMSFGALLVLSLAGCATIESRYAFSPPMTNADIMFDVVDRRPDADKGFVAIGASPPSYKYGDDQFVPAPIRVVASHFAAAFSAPTGGTRLAIDQLEIVNRLPRPLGNSNGGGGDPMALPVLMLRWAFESRERNSVTCRLAGTYAGREFSVTRRVDYDMPGSREHYNAVSASLQAAIAKAIEGVGGSDKYGRTR